MDPCNLFDVLWSGIVTIQHLGVSSLPLPKASVATFLLQVFLLSALSLSLS